MREGSKEGQLRMGERTRRSGDKSGPVGREGHGGSRYGWQLQSSLPLQRVNPAPRNCQDVESPVASLQTFASSRR